MLIMKCRRVTRVDPSKVMQILFIINNTFYILPCLFIDLLLREEGFTCELWIRGKALNIQIFYAKFILIRAALRRSSDLLMYETFSISFSFCYCNFEFKNFKSNPKSAETRTNFRKMISILFNIESLLQTFSLHFNQGFV